MEFLIELLFYLVQLLIGLVQSLISWIREGRHRKPSKYTQKKIAQELMRFYTFNQAEKTGFVQKCVTLVHEMMVSDGNAQGYGWHRLYKNQHGHYFLFICNNNDEPYFTHLAPERAKNFLLDAPHIRQQEFPEGAPK